MDAQEIVVLNAMWQKYRFRALLGTRYLASLRALWDHWDDRRRRGLSTMSWDAYSQYVLLQGNLMLFALGAARHADSYRGFRVGAAGLFTRKPFAEVTSSSVEIFTGANSKPYKDGPKCCAEETAINTARSAGYPWVIALAVAGVPQEDSTSGLTTLTLHPCASCRDTLHRVAAPDARVITLHLEQDGVVEEHALDELLARHSHRLCAT